MHDHVNVYYAFVKNVLSKYYYYYYYYYYFEVFVAL